MINLLFILHPWNSLFNGTDRNLDSREGKKREKHVYYSILFAKICSIDRSIDSRRWCYISTKRRIMDGGVIIVVTALGGKFSTIMTIMTAHIEKAIILIKNQTTNKNWINNLFRDVTNKSFNREYIYIYINPLFTHFKINVVITIVIIAWNLIMRLLFRCVKFFPTRFSHHRDLIARDNWYAI